MTAIEEIRDDDSVGVDKEDDGTFRLTFPDRTTKFLTEDEYDAWERERQEKREAEAGKVAHQKEMDKLSDPLDCVDEDLYPQEGKEEFMKNLKAKTPGGIKHVQESIKNKQALNWV